MTPEAPPHPRTESGHLRRVGVEIEFAAIAPSKAAELVRAHFGGTLEHLSPHRLKVSGSQWGDFTIELDSKYVHPDHKVVEKAGTQDDEWQHLRLELHQRTRRLLGDAVAGIVPTEIVCPPIPWLALNELDALFDALRLQGARDTRDSLLYGFGLHLNPEVASAEASDLLAQLRAYMILAAWLREEIDIDITREVLPHANPFTKEYALKILDPGYAPDLDTLIDDYLVANPSRNRELDLFPLFAYLRPGHPSPLLADELVKPRPTFHYRLPNAQLSQPDWSAVSEWNRWVEVERLAADADLLAERGAAYVEYHRRSSVTQWLNRLKEWMKDS
ncbi:Putative amidoligase enzyme [Modicisalibacter ilicicola DSM 19980]|uniref:Putative amidoligase enzyme n=1 Tax=Modicisalibacter ilicicola DSM 19980 TaxID=1121942 RepID=A0A1M4XZR1_9GAMM|nr:amidoligase family protein [Halomonas ilicicola]SHE98826.1 Putative amidoligase enzyme [Halomonas ilicicola DSM 19980]